jgi:hypothetical protein
MFHEELFLKETYLCGMRKRWTPQTEINEAVLLFREKRKWQIALRRYLIEAQKSSRYAPFFGLDARNFRKWIEIQFEPELSWDNFSRVWQLDHRIPTACFDFSLGEDMKLCWNFINIYPAKIEKQPLLGLGILSAKGHFLRLFGHSGYDLCQKMVKKIEKMEMEPISEKPGEGHFLKENLPYLEQISGLDPEEFNQLNSGTPFAEILAAKVLIRKFGQME